jgi:hypothetical protein
MDDIKAQFNRWAAGLGQGHDKHLSIKCPVAGEDVAVILHNRGQIDTITRSNAMKIVRYIIEDLCVNKKPFDQQTVVSNIEIFRDVLVPDVAFMCVYLPMGDGFLLTMSGTLLNSEVVRVRKESAKQSAEQEDKWRDLMP